MYHKELPSYWTRLILVWYKLAMKEVLFEVKEQRIIPYEANGRLLD
jgi:hypothetical protein